MNRSIPSTARRFLESYSGAAAEDTAILPVRRYERVLMATWNVLLLVERPEGAVSGPMLDRAAAEAFRLMARLEEELSKFLPESEVSLMNALAAGQPVRVSRALFHILETCKRCWEATGGAFDPTVGPLLRAWGFDHGNHRVPEEEEIRELLEAQGMDHVQLEPDRQEVRFDRPGVAVDLGAIGKGYISDRAAAFLKGQGIEAGALLSGRSTIVVWGNAPDGGRWRVGVADPNDPDEDFLELAVAGGSISTSAGYERKFSAGGVEYGHIFDPRRGRPVRPEEQGCLGVTVWTREAMTGDAISTALYVLGRETGEAALEAFAPISAVFLEIDSSVWGGIRSMESHRGVPGFEVVNR